ncbi:MAG: 6-phosphofructokinase [Verrucomicrobiaceae bacterium]|nr:6-phosphofructokinase [Verrucomicrobiaceae bacterium]
MSVPLLKLADRPVLVLFSGGDAPGMNACLRALARLGINRHNVPILAVRQGYRGLVEAARQARTVDGLASLKHQIETSTGRLGLIDRKQQLILMDHASVSAIVRIGGIILGSARCKEFLQPAVRAEVIALLKELNVRGIVICGGDGSLAGAELLAKESNLKVVGIPATIDNDLDYTEMALGVDTAVNTVAENVDRFKDTAKSHRRVMVLEVMGRASGELARLAAIASGAEMVVTPRHALKAADVTKLAESLAAGLRQGRSHAIVMVAEGVAFEPEIMRNDPRPFAVPDDPDQPPAQPVLRNRAYVLADAFQDYFAKTDDLNDLEIRPSVLGHLQRGGDATPGDAILAAKFAEAAMRQVMDESAGNGITALQYGRVKVVPFGAEALPDRQEIMSSMDDLHGIMSSW